MSIDNQNKVLSEGEQRRNKNLKPFSKGDPRINREGRPKGIRSPGAMLIEQVTEGHINKALDNIEMALAAGDPKISQWLIERISPQRKVAMLNVELPEIKKSSDIFEAVNTINRYVSSGEISADEATELLKPLEALRKTDENIRLEAKIADIEEILSNKGVG